MTESTAKTKAVLQAIFVTGLWSTSWVLIKLTLDEIPPLVFAGLRYSFATIFLLPGLIQQKRQIKALSRRDWIRLTILGILFYSITQGGQFLTLNHLNASTFSLLLNFTSVIVAILGIFSLREIPSLSQWVGIVVFMAGVMIFFFPFGGQSGDPIGFVFAGVTVIANALSSLLGRKINRTQNLSPSIVTGISMGVGSAILLTIGVMVEGFPRLSFINILVILWLALVNTAFAFHLWNRSLQVLSAVESSAINNSMLIQIAFLAWVFLGERLILRQVIALGMAALGIVLTNVIWPLNNAKQIKEENTQP